jgi:DNA transposition AAA+ family ATPase
MITVEQKLKVVESVKKAEKDYPSASRFSVVLGINPGQLSRIKNGQIENVLSEAKWITIARKLNVELGNNTRMRAAETPVFQAIISQLENCQANSMSALLVDSADIGKTFAARHYAHGHKNAIYIDCSQSKTKQKLIRTIAKELGVINTGRYVDVYEDLVYYIKTIPQPLIILDEAGDLDYGAWLELKALWNATEYACGWYMMGADGLQAKIDGNIGRKKVGYTEIFSRFGSKYQRITPHGESQVKDFMKTQTAIIAKANGISDVQALYAKTKGSLRRIYIEVQKRKAS